MEIVLKGFAVIRDGAEGWGGAINYDKRCIDSSDGVNISSGTMGIK
jgi:hypothetical protein